MTRFDDLESWLQIAQFPIIQFKHDNGASSMYKAC